MNLSTNLKTLMITSLISAFFIGGVGAHEYEKGDLLIDHPWSRATPTTAKVGGGYMHVFNKSDTAEELVSVTSPVSDKIEIHEMAVVDDIMKMRQLNQPLAIPANSDVEFKPGGYHIMFMNIKQPFVEGQSFPATLHFQKAGDVEVKFVIDAMGAKQSGHSHEGHEHH